MTDIPETVVAAQRTFDAAWADLEAFRKQVDADRQATAQPATERHRSPVLRPWTAEEDAEYARLHQAVVEAAGARREGMQREGVASTWDAEREIRAAARAGGEAE